MEIPNLSGVSDPDHVSLKGTGNFTAKYINWARTLQDIRDSAPGWMPETVEDFNGNDIHKAPDGTGYLKIRFVHTDGTQTVCVPHAIMDHKMNPIPGDKISARDISDGFVRGACKAAAALFGYAWQMWTRDDPMERQNPSPPPAQEKKDEKDDKADPLDEAKSFKWPGKKKHNGKTLGSIMEKDPTYLPTVLKENHETLKKTDEHLLSCVEAVVLHYQDNGKQDFSDAA